MGRQAGLGPLNLFYLGRRAASPPSRPWWPLRFGRCPSTAGTVAAGPDADVDLLAASSSADALSIVVRRLLGIAMILRLALRPQKAGRGSLWLLLAVLVLVGLAKPGYVAISLLCMLIPKEKFSDPRQGWWIRGLLVGLPLAVSVAWVLSVPGLFRAGPAVRRREGPGPVDAGTSLDLLRKLMMEKITEWYLYSRVVATLGWGSVFLPAGLSTRSTGAALLASAVLDGGRRRPAVADLDAGVASVARCTSLSWPLIATLTYLTWHACGSIGIQRSPVAILRARCCRCCSCRLRGRGELGEQPLLAPARSGDGNRGRPDWCRAPHGGRWSPGFDRP